MKTKMNVVCVEIFPGAVWLFIKYNNNNNLKPT